MYEGLKKRITKKKIYLYSRFYYGFTGQWCYYCLSSKKHTNQNIKTGKI